MCLPEKARSRFAGARALRPTGGAEVALADGQGVPGAAHPGAPIAVSSIPRSEGLVRCTTPPLRIRAPSLQLLLEHLVFSSARINCNNAATLEAMFLRLWHVAEQRDRATIYAHRRTQA